jgi:hypothetical protein
MRMLGLTALVALAAAALPGSVNADPGKDESGKGRWRHSYQRDSGPRGPYGARDFRNEGPSERRAFKQEYDDGTCKYERKLKKSGEYKEEVKCKGGRRPSYSERY